MALVEEPRSVHAAKNIMRVLSIGVDYGVVGSQAYSLNVLQLLDECISGAGGKLTTKEHDLVLETVITGLLISVRYFLL